MADAPDLQARQTNQPRTANLRVVTGATRLDDEARTALEVDLYGSWNACYTARQNLNDNLRAWDAMYRLEVAPQDWPWENAANLVLPIIPAELDTMKSNVAAQVFVQRMVIVTAADDDPETQRLAPSVEKYYNNELRRIRSDGKSFIDHLRAVLHLGLRDGTAPCDILFTERVEPRLIVTEEPKFVDDDVVLGDDGDISTERVMTRVEETVAEVSIRPRLLKEWYIAPDESTAVQSALGVFTVEWMTEKEMWEKVHEFKESGGPGEWYADAVDLVLQRLASGVTDVSSDVLGQYDKDAGGQIDIGQGQGAVVSKFFKNRGPAQIIRAFSDQFDLNDDGVAEKNVFWFHQDYPKLLGWAPFEYVSGQWPTLAFCPFPDPCRVYGFSLVERLADIVAEANAGRNQRRNYIDLELMPIQLRREGDQIRDHDGAFYPGMPMVVPDINESIKWWSPNALSSDSFSDEARLDTYVAKLTGQNAPALGAQSSGRRTATESRQQQLAQSVRANDVAMEYRAFLRSLVQYWHTLNKQFLGASKNMLTTKDEHGDTVQLDPAVLTRKFSIDIAGLSDPVDAGTRRQEIMSAMGVAAKVFPDVFQDPVLAYGWKAAFVDTFQWTSPEMLIGTYEDAVNRKKAMEQAAQMQAQMALGGGGGTPPAGQQPPGNPQANGHAPQPQPQPAPHPGGPQ